MVSEKLSNLEVMTKANVYWDGKVTSRTFFTADGEKHTLGIITAGYLHLRRGRPRDRHPHRR